MRKPSARDLIFLALCVALLAGAMIFFASRDGKSLPVFETQKLAASQAQGTPPRIEREFKVGLILPTLTGVNPNEYLRDLQMLVYESLQAEVEHEDWQVPQLLGRKYYIARDPMAFIARDIYLDTRDDIAFDNAISYRLRHRFESLNKLDDHERNPTVPREFPYRCEVQSKVDRAEIGDGRSTVSEARFEFRIESAPFSELNPPPPPPWYPKDYLPIIQTGMFQDETMTPGQDLGRFLLSRGIEENVRFEPRVVVNTTRMRMHLDIPTPYGSGPNPEQAFILSIDRSYVYEGRPYMEYLLRNWYEVWPRPAPSGVFYEIEIEFERNVSTNLDSRIDQTHAPKLLAIREAFFADQTRIRDVAVRSLKEMNIQGEARPMSKYSEARLFLQLDLQR
ncbi:hypothetical protein HQ520_07490 [bacterium]|nr:hypothetical protein [bacterium]